MELSNQGVGAAVMPQTKSTFERIIGVFVSPEPTMQDIAARPSWLLPLIIVAIVSSVGGFFLKDAIVQQQLEAMEKRNMTVEQIEQSRPMMEKMINITAPLFGLIGTPVTYVIIAAIAMFVGSVILGGETKFAKLFSVICWSGLITVLSSVINIPVMVNRQALESATSLNILLSPDAKDTFIYNLLSQVDLFTIWWIVVVGFGFAAVYKFSTRKAMTTVFIVWAIIALASAGLKSMFS
jgi:hypothetical protein